MFGHVGPQENPGRLGIRAHQCVFCVKNADEIAPSALLCGIYRACSIDTGGHHIKYSK